jgi:hypothetical protein
MSGTMLTGTTDTMEMTNITDMTGRMDITRVDIAGEISMIAMAAVADGSLFHFSQKQKRTKNEVGKRVAFIP